MTRLRRLAGRLGLLAGSTLAALLLAELLVRLLLPQPLVTVRPDIWVPVEGLGHRLAPDQSTTVDTGGGEVRLITDGSGHRVGSPGPRAGAPRILALGDSFVEALQVEYEETMTARLERRLSNETGAPAVVVNAGVSAWNPSHYLLKAREELPGRGYDHVLTFLFLGNDLKPKRVDSFPPRQPARHRVRLPDTLGRRELVDAVIHPLFGQLRSRSHLVVLARERSSDLLRGLGLTRGAFPTVMLTTQSEAPVWAITADLCEEIARQAADHGAGAQFVLIPSDYHLDPEQARAFARGAGLDPSLVDADQPARLLTHHLEGRGLEVVDLTPALRRSWASGQRIHGRVDRHLTASGHEIAADAIYPALLESLGEGSPR